MKQAFIVFPHQLFKDLEPIPFEATVFLTEEMLFFTQYAFHKQKIWFHRASMRYYLDLLAERFHVNYISARDTLHDCRLLVGHMQQLGFDHITIFDPVDNWLLRRMREACKSASIQLKVLESPNFLNTSDDLRQYADRYKRFFQTHFYIEQRKRMQVLIDEQGKPEGGQWSFDAANRRPYPKNTTPPSLSYPELQAYDEEAIRYVETNFPTNPGSLAVGNKLPATHEEARNWLHDFIDRRLFAFGTYEDAMVRHHRVLHHSLLSPLINVGLLQAREVLDAVLEGSIRQGVEMNNTEGFVRQLIGWREFIRMVYLEVGSVQRKTNHWHFSRRIPSSFYTGETGILPVDETIRHVLKTGYCHHIERLMILGNFMLLCEFNPDEVYRWFMELFVDAYDWVMVPNVYGMSQFADGGLMATKPYISGSNYILKMSDYPRGAWCETWDALFWNFLHQQRAFFSRNPRLAMLLRQFDKRPPGERQALLDKARAYLTHLDS